MRIQCFCFKVHLSIVLQNGDVKQNVGVNVALLLAFRFDIMS